MVRLSRKRSFWLVLGVLLAGLTITGLALSRAVGSAREAAWQNSCNCRMCDYSLSFAAYYRKNETYPPEYVEASDGKRRSWLQLLDDAMHESLDLDCPSKRARFVAVTGPDAILDGPHATTPDEVSDGCENTLLLIECTLSEIERAGSDELHLDELGRWFGDDIYAVGTTIHPDGRGLVFGDCADYRLTRPIPLATFRALLTRSGGEKITREQLIEDGVLAHVGWHAEIP